MGVCEGDEESLFRGDEMSKKLGEEEIIFRLENLRQVDKFFNEFNVEVTDGE